MPGSFSEGILGSALLCWMWLILHAAICRSNSKSNYLCKGLGQGFRANAFTRCLDIHIVACMQHPCDAFASAWCITLHFTVSLFLEGTQSCECQLLLSVVRHPPPRILDCPQLQCRRLAESTANACSCCMHSWHYKQAIRQTPTWIATLTLFCDESVPLLSCSPAILKLMAPAADMVWCCLCSSWRAS
jgi:hypothetical protein